MVQIGTGSQFHKITNMFAASKSGSVAAKDAQFPYVTMLLHGDGTSGAQNNTFLDSSTNNFTITRNGNTTQGTFTPYGSNWSNYFNGNNLSTASSSAFNCAADFTLEAWIFPTTAWAGSGSYNPILFVNGTGLYFGQNSAGFGLRQSATANIISYATSPTVNVWTHVAIVRSGSTITMYYNGTSVATATSSATFSTGAATIASDGSYAYTGYVSNLRLVKGTAVYTSAFTPSTTPLTAITNTSFLTCQSNQFIDNSTSALALTSSGSPSVQRFSPFSPTTAYSTSVIGGSGYFDGSGDYLTTPSSADFGFSTGDFTVECWVYPLSSAAQRLVFFSNDMNNLDIGFSPANTFQYYNGSVVNTGISAASQQWFHFAASRTSGTTSVYVNGVRTNNVADTSSTSTRSVLVASSSGTYPFNGYINDVRVIKGTGIYSGTTITVPTAPLTAVTNTKLLLNYTNAGILDNAMMNDLETVGNAQISTSVKKYGTGSMYFDGSGDYLPFVNRLITDFGTGDFTVECWVYKTTSSGADQVIIDARAANSATPWIISITNANTIYFYNGTTYTTSSSISLNTWSHIAVSRSSGTLKIFIDGVSGFSGSVTANLDKNAGGKIGSDVSGNSVLYGYIDDLRITKGVARYTATFTAPTAAFPNN